MLIYTQLICSHCNPTPWTRQPPEHSWQCSVTHRNTLLPPSSPISSVCHKEEWVLLVLPPAVLYSRGHETHPREGAVTSRGWPGMCILLSQYLLFEESAVADWGKSPAPADPTPCGPFPSCLGDPFTPYSWHLLPLPCALLRPPVLHLSPAHTGQLLQEGGEATQGVSAAPRTPTIPPQQAPNACKASVGHAEWAPDSVTGNDKAVPQPEGAGGRRSNRVARAQESVSEQLGPHDRLSSLSNPSLIGSTSFSSDASMLAFLVSKLLGFKSKTK